MHTETDFFVLTCKVSYTENIFMQFMLHFSATLCFFPPYMAYPLGPRHANSPANSGWTGVGGAYRSFEHDPCPLSGPLKTTTLNSLRAINVLYLWKMKINWTKGNRGENFFLFQSSQSQNRNAKNRLLLALCCRIVLAVDPQHSPPSASRKTSGLWGFPRPFYYDGPYVNMGGVVALLLAINGRTFLMLIICSSSQASRCLRFGISGKIWFSLSPHSVISHSGSFYMMPASATLECSSWL